MIDWLLDSAFWIYVFLSLFALGFLLLYRNNRDRGSLIALATIVGAGLLLWILSLFIVTDRQQIERNLHAMVDATLNNKPEELAKHLASDFTCRAYKRDDVIKLAPAKAKEQNLTDVRISALRMEPLADGKMKVTFNATGFLSGDPVPTQCEAEFVFRSGKWQMRTIEVYFAVGRQRVPF